MIGREHFFSLVAEPTSNIDGIGLALAALPGNLPRQICRPEVEGDQRGDVDEEHDHRDHVADAQDSTHRDLKSLSHALKAGSSPALGGYGYLDFTEAFIGDCASVAVDHGGALAHLRRH